LVTSNRVDPFQKGARVFNRGRVDQYDSGRPVFMGQVLLTIGGVELYQRPAPP
jgi:hypothetical protein